MSAPDAIYRARCERTLAAMARRSIDLLLLSRYRNGVYLSGARRVQVAGSGGGVPWLLLFAGDERPIVYTSDLDGVPRWLGPSGQPLCWDSSRIAEVVRRRAPRRVAYDVMSPRFVGTLDAATPPIEWIDGAELLAEARAVSEPDEAASLERARQSAETALAQMLAAVGAGASEREIVAVGMRAAVDAGASFLAEEPIARLRDGAAPRLEVVVCRDGEVGEATAGARAPSPREEPPRDSFLAELAQARRAKVDRAIATAGLDALVLLKSANVRYATGAVIHHAEASREALAPAAAALLPGRTALVVAPDRHGLADAIPAERVEESFFLDDAIGAERLARLLVDTLPAAGRVAIDRWSEPLRRALVRALPLVEWVDAETILAPERMIKLPDEITLLRRAQQLNERAIESVLASLRPGLREIELTAIFHEALGRLGVTTVHVESVWCALPKTTSEAPWTAPNSFPYRELTDSTRVLTSGDLVVMDTGILHEGYLSDFGRTWLCGRGRPSAAERRLFEEWREIRDRLIDACRPGRTALDLRRAALAGWRRAEPPWPVPLYVAHSIGLGGVEPPFVGTDLGEAVEDRWRLEAGMVLVFEPYVWEEGTGGYRAEETVVVTETACERLTSFPYGAFES